MKEGQAKSNIAPLFQSGAIMNQPETEGKQTEAEKRGTKLKQTGKKRESN